MALKRLNENIYFDTDDIITKEETTLSLPLPNFRDKRHNDFEILQTKNFARIIASNDFIAKASKIKKGTKGAYIEVKIIKTPYATIVMPLVKIGENSWIKGSFIATDAHNSFIERGVVIGENSFIESNATIKRGALIGSGCIVGYASTIGEKSDIRNNCYIRPLSVIGPRTLLGDSVKFTGHEEAPKIGITPLFETRYCRQHRINPKTFGRDNKPYKERLIEKLKECYHSRLQTRIGENVKIQSGVRIYSGATVSDGAILKSGTTIKAKGNFEKDQDIRILP